MKISAFPFLLSLIIAAALAYLAGHISHSHDDAEYLVVGIGTGLSILSTLSCLMAVKLENPKMSVNMKTWSAIALIIMIIVNYCFAFFGVAQPYYIIILALSLVFHLWMVWKMKETKEV